MKNWEVMEGAELSFCGWGKGIEDYGLGFRRGGGATMGERMWDVVGGGRVGSRCYVLLRADNTGNDCVGR